MESALYEASVVPMEIMETVLSSMDLLETAGGEGQQAGPKRRGGWASVFAQAALEGASLNVFINTRLMKDRSQAEGAERPG